MTNWVLLPPLDRFGGQAAYATMKRWGITIPEIAARAGVRRTKLTSWLRGQTPISRFPERGAVYDAVLTRVVEQSAWAAAEAKRLRAERDRHFALLPHTLRDGDHPV